MKALVLEGPCHSIMHGWRHFQIIIQVEGRQKVISSIGPDGSGQKTAQTLRGKLFAAGTWEVDAGDMRNLNRFPAPRPEILDLLVSQKQTEFAV